MPGSAESLTLRATLLAARGRDPDALRTLGPVLRGEAEVHVRTTLVTADLLAWRLQTRAGDSLRGYESLERALAWAAPQNFRRPFLDAGGEMWETLAGNAGRFGRADAFVTDLLAHFTGGGRHSARTPEPTPTLSVRELEVLRDLPSQLKAADIAATRMISLNTLKTRSRPRRAPQTRGLIRAPSTGSRECSGRKGAESGALPVAPCMPLGPLAWGAHLYH